LDDFGQFSRELPAGFNKLSERVLKLELELQHTKEQHAREVAHLRDQQAAEREHFRLQLENLILRLQRGLPPPEPTTFPAVPAQQPSEPSPNEQAE